MVLKGLKKSVIQFGCIVCVWVLLVLPSAALSFPTQTLVLSDEVASRSEAPHLLYYAEVMEDPEGQLTLSSVLKTDKIFETIDTVGAINDANGSVDLHLTHSTYWLRLDVRNDSSKEDWYFTMPASLSRDVQLFLGIKGSPQSFVQQKLLTHSRAIKYHLLLPTNSLHRLYVSVHDQHAPLVIGMNLRSSTQMLDRVMLIYPLFSFIMGGLLILAIYNLFYFVYFRDDSFLALSVFIVCFVLEMGNHSGVWYYFEFLHPYQSWVGTTFGLIGIAASTVIANSWLETKPYLPRHYFLFRITFWLSLLSIPVHLKLGYGTVFVGLLALIFILIFASATLFRYRQGFRFPNTLSMGILLVVVSFTPPILRGMDLIADMPILSESTYFTLLLALVLLSLTQAEQVRIKGEHAERIAASNKAKDEFLTTMSHELRTPMTAVVNAGRLLQRTPLSGSQKEYVSRLNTSSQHMLSLINDILDLARLDSQLLEVETIPFRLEKIVLQLKHLLGEQASNKNVLFILDNQFHPLKKQLQGDPTRLQQVLLNLLSNAIKFTPKQGEVSLTIIPQDVTSDTASLLFKVQDSGIGMSAEQQQKLFKPFSQADGSTARKYGGSGLGLVISQKLVQRMGGKLEVSSELGQGSAFFFTLTLSLEEHMPTVELTDTVLEPSVSLAGFRVLLVDDEEMNRFFGSKLIGSLGVDVKVAESGEATLQLLENHTFDLVFMDVSMPEMDGYETTRRIRTNRRFVDLPIVALTAHAIAGERERCLAAGMDDYLTKPFELEQLEMLILQQNSQTIHFKNHRDKNF